jgi:beta-1,2-mannosyltransferase
LAVHISTVVPQLTILQGDRSRYEHYQQWGDFEPMQIPGFVNTGLPGKRACDTLKYNSTVGVQQSFHLADDIHQIALALDQHPVVDYPDELMNDPQMNVRDIVEKTWQRLTGSSVWLPQQKVYLSVTRVIFSPSGTRMMPKMSFLRGQLFDENWEHLDNHTITWSGKRFEFPMVFDIPAQWVDDGSMFGPEDPQIVLEHGVEDAEPVVVFNMVGRKSDWKRAMYIYRPFSSASTILTIKDTERAFNEKNWAPFFIPEEEQHTLLGKLPLTIPGYVRKPNEYIHFVYSFRPLRILKCHMRCGDCEFEYEQDAPQKALNRHHDEAGDVRGGTNFVPVPIPSNMDIDPRVRVYAAFTQTNIAKYCDGNFYHPEFTVMVNIGRQFQLAYASESLDFGNVALELGPDDDRCEEGHILSPNTVARWDTSGTVDIMTVTFSVNDETSQVTRLRGLLGFVRNLPQFKNLLKRNGLLKGADADLVSVLASWTGDDVRGCLIESAANFTGAKLEATNPRDEEQEMDLTWELADRLRQIKDEEAQRRRQKEVDPAIGRDYNPGVPTLEHPPADDDGLFNPSSLGEFNDVEGLAVEGLEYLDDVVEADSKKVDVKKDDPKKDDLKKEDTKKDDLKKEDPEKDESRKDDSKKNDQKKDDSKKDDPKKDDPKKDELKKDESKDGEEKQDPKGNEEKPEIPSQGEESEDRDGIDDSKPSEDLKVEHPVDQPAQEAKKEDEKKPEDATKAAHDHGGHHRYHKQQNRRRNWP